MRLYLQQLTKLFAFLLGVCTVQWMLSGAPDSALHPADCKSSSSAPAAPVAISERPPDPRPVRIFCMILTHPKQYANLAVRVNNTWARRCDKYYFIGSLPTNVSIPMLYLPLVESRRILWKKVRMAFEAVHARERLDDFDYFLKADDDTFVVIENLHSLLRGRDPEEATIFGRRFAYLGDKKQQYMSGGAGYVLSRRALGLLVTTGFGSTRRKGTVDYCNLQYITVEDYLMGRCLSQIGVKFEDSLDEQKRERFHPLRPETMVNPGHAPEWIKQYNYHPFERCVTCISNTSISFHYVDNVLELEFMLYHIRVAK